MCLITNPDCSGIVPKSLRDSYLRVDSTRIDRIMERSRQIARTTIFMAVLPASTSQFSRSNDYKNCGYDYDGYL